MQTMHWKGYKLELDEEMRACLTAIWKLAGRPPGKTPSKFRNLKRNRIVLDMDKWKIIRGRYAATWVNILVARDYAEYVGLEAKVEPQPQPEPQPEPYTRAWEEGEEWKGEATDSWTTGEEWQATNATAMADEEWQPQPEPQPAYFAPGTIFIKSRGCDGPDDLFFELSDLEGSPVPRASVN